MSKLGKRIWFILIVMNVIAVIQVAVFGVVFIGPLTASLLGTVLLAFLEWRSIVNLKGEK